MSDDLRDSIIKEVLQERERQVSVEGYTVSHDDLHFTGELALAAASYAQVAGYASLYGTQATRLVPLPRSWPWSPDWWKPKDPRRDLIRAAALVIAEIERIDRSRKEPQ